MQFFPRRLTLTLAAKKEVHHTLRPPSPLRHPLGRSHDGSGPRVGMLAGMHLPPDKKRKSTAVLELDDLKEMHAQQRMQEELKRKREEDPKNSAAEKIRKQIERHETIKSRQLEREEKKKKKAEETAARKREIEERKAEKEGTCSLLMHLQAGDSRGAQPRSTRRQRRPPLCPRRCRRWARWRRSPRPPCAPSSTQRLCWPTRQRR